MTSGFRENSIRVQKFKQITRSAIYLLTNIINMYSEKVLINYKHYMMQLITFMLLKYLIKCFKIIPLLRMKIVSSKLATQVQILHVYVYDMLDPSQCFVLLLKAKPVWKFKYLSILLRFLNPE